MKAEQVDKALHQKFFVEDERIVFWYDPKEEFTDYVSGDLGESLSDIRILHMDIIGGLSTKIRVEREDTDNKYLLYSSQEVPPADEDWLLDIRLYSSHFHADLTSIWLQELGLTNLSLKDHLEARSRFLRSQGRRQKLGRLVTPADNEDTLDAKMMAVVVGSQDFGLFEILRSICHLHQKDNAFDLHEKPVSIDQFEKMGLADTFWRFVEQEFEYSSDRPTVAGLLRKLFISELYQQMDGAEIKSLAHYLLPEKGQRNSRVFLTQWRDSNTTYKSFDGASSAISGEQKVREPLADYGLDVVQNVFTFWEAEKLVVSQLKERVLAEKGIVDPEQIADIANKRKAGHWLSGPSASLSERRAIADAYDAVVAAAKLFELNSVTPDYSFDSADELLVGYRDGLFEFDNLYRTFCTNSRSSVDEGWDILKTLTDEVEKVYDQGFLQPLGLAWSRLLDEGFLSTWKTKDLPPQQRFFANTIQSVLAESGQARAFVIISDAFRYEAAVELTSELNGTYRVEADLSAMLGVLPSYTALGMASLLPHENISYSDNGSVLADGNSTDGTDARNKQLAVYGGMACQAKDLVRMKREAARCFVRDARVVYIYHNVIDACGDSGQTEGETFECVERCIDELGKLVNFCLNTLNGSRIWITADHGFLFRQNPLGETDSSRISQKPSGSLKSNNRFLLGRGLGTATKAHHGKLAATADAGGDMEFWIPRGANRFHFGGGARYVHGGAMPQEVVIPLITISHLRGRKKQVSKVKKVSIQVLGQHHKITTSTYRFELIQTEAVSERRQPITVRAAIYEELTAVTSIETLTFDSESENMQDRKKSIKLALQAGTFDKNKEYRLVLRDAETEAEVQSLNVIIDRSFEDDF